MNTNEMIFMQLASPPSKQVNELPVVTTNTVLPFEKLTWEDFEKFCFQLGSKSMNCLDTSYIYGRRGQKQDGIDLYFHHVGKNKVWQIKRYAEFTRNDVSAAVESFLNGKWFGNATEFTLCVSNYLDDTGVVDEINTQSSILESKGIVFSVLNSEKLTLKAKSFPELIKTFFGNHWLDALGVTQPQKSNLKNEPRWQTESGIILNPQQIYHHGDFNIKLDGPTVYIDETLPTGTDMHAMYDFKTGVMHIDKFPYPLEEYKIDVPPNLIIRIEEKIITISNEKYYAKKYHLKWGKHAIFVFDYDTHKKLMDLQIYTQTFINHNEKTIHILDPALETVEL